MTWYQILAENIDSGVVGQCFGLDSDFYLFACSGLFPF